MTALAGRFVGRADELASLDLVLSGLDQRRPAVIVLSGEPGIGKTRLLSEVAARADARRWLVLRGSASELERDLPFSVFVDALDEHLRSVEPGLVAALDEDVRTELAHVFPSLSALATGRRLALQHERYRTHRAVRALLEHLAEPRPLMLTLDDLHWADSASIELLGALLRRPPLAPMLVAIAFRPRRGPEGLMAALAGAERVLALTRIELGALTSDEAREFLGESVDATDASVLYGESGGNPFYLEQLARSLDRVATRRPSAASPAGIEVPSAVATALKDELARLTVEERRVIEGAAVAGDPFEPELVAAASGTTEPETMLALDELLRLDLIRSTDVPRRFRFRHPLVRRAVYESTAGGWRLGAHERCAEALAARGASPTQRAHHIERSAREGDLDAVAVLREAGEAAVRLAPASAARWFAEALRLLPHDVPVAERIELLLARAGSLTASGHFSDAYQALLGALDILPGGSPAAYARLTRACAGTESLLGHHERARDRLDRALQRLWDSDEPEVVALLIELAMNGFWRARHQAMHESAERAVLVARRIGDVPLVAAGLAVRALADSVMGAPCRAEAAIAEATRLVDSLPDDQLVRRLDAAAWLAGAELYLDRYVGADMHADRALGLARASGQGELILVLVQILGRVWCVRGRLAEAAELLDGGIEAARLLGNEQALVWNLFNRSSVALAVGDLDAALDTAQESVDRSRHLDQGFHSAWAAVRLAGVLLETGRPESAIELLLDSAGGEDLVLIPGSWRAYCLELLTRCWLAEERQVEADRAAAAAAAWAGTVRLPLATAWAERAAAAVELRAGEPVRAASQALASAAGAAGAGAPVEAGLSRVLAGRALGQAGETDSAVAELQCAAADLDACGALRYRDLADSELRKLGQQVHRRTTPGRSDLRGIQSLTERELQVARLVAGHRTNPEIAAELFLSRKTVETHLRNIFHKVGVSSRRELARAVERTDREVRDALA